MSRPIVDGALNDPCWKAEKVNGSFWRLGVKQGERSDATRFWTTRDDRWLYFAFDCRNPEMRRVKQTRFGHDGAVQEDDSVEVFLDPGTEGKLYYHLILTFANCTGDRRCSASGRDQTWDMPWRSATQRTNEGWTGEAAIPLFILQGYGDVSLARINVCRNMVAFGLDGIGEATVRQRQFYSWAQLRRSFHEPKRFATLVGLAEAKVSPPFLPAVITAKVSGYAVEPDRKRYQVRGQIRNYTTVAGMVTVAVIDETATGESREATTEIDVPGMSHQVFMVEVPVTSMVQRRVTVQLRDTRTGEVLQTHAIEDVSSLALMDDPLLDRNYYTNEAEAVVRCKFGLPSGALGRTRLVAKGTGGAVMAASDRVEPTTLFAVPIAGLPTGEHRIAIELQQANGQLLTGKSVMVVKKRPHSAGEVKIDRHSRVVLKDGKPFLPFGVYMNCNSRTEAGWSQHVKWVADAGFNTIGRWSRVDPKDASKLFDLAEKHDLAVVDSACHYIERGKPIKENIDRVVQGIEAVRDYRNLICYYTVDEPNLVARHVGSFDKVMDDCELIYKTVEEHDGYHPVFMLYARDIPPHPEATRWSDILGYDIYLTGGMASFYGTPDFMAGFIAMLDKRAASVNQVTWAVPLAERLDPRRTPRALLPEEHRSQVYLALINGAKGFMYFVYSGMAHKWSWDALSGLAQQTEALAPAVLAPDVPQEITYSSGVCDPANRKFTDVQAKLFRHPDGRHILLAANSRYYPVDVTFTTSGLKGAAKRLFSESTHEVQKGSFSDKIEWCGVRAYALDLGQRGEEPVEIKVDLTPHPDDARKEDRVRVNALRAGKRNVMVNASFEEQSLPGWPDFTTPYRLEGRPAISEPGALWGADTDQPYHGKHCLRVTRQIGGDGPICWGFFGISYPPPLDGPTPYTLSMYIRAQKPGQRAWVRVTGVKEKTFDLTTEWERYHLSGTFKPDRFRDKGILVCPFPDGATVWFDAFQMEVGVEPTPFTED